MPPKQAVIQPNQRVFITGKTGSGKTYLARRLLSSARRLVVIDSKGQLDDWNLEAWDNQSRRNLRERAEVRVRVMLPAGQDPDRFWSDVLSEAYEAGDLFLYIDEVYLMDVGKATRWALRAIWTTGRSYGIGAIAVSQRPRDIPRFLITEAEHFFMFRLVIFDDLKYMSDIMTEAVRVGVNPKDKYGFWYYDANDVRPHYYTRLPERATGESEMRDVPAVSLTGAGG